MPELNALQKELRRLAAERDVVILAHNYQRPEVQDAADHTGDSLELSRIAAKDPHQVILFCGVHFMAETAYILAPQKTVLMPDKRAGCPMADMVTVAGLRRLKAEHPDAVVVAYVNTSADIKAETDVCCTSANAVQIVERFPKDQKIIFVPDRNLGDYVARQTGREETMILWQGWCHVHDDFRAAEIEQIRAAQPGQRAHGPPGEPARGARDRRRGHEHVGDAPLSADERRPDVRRGHRDGPAVPARACCTRTGRSSRPRTRRSART